jgi:hypothetical protein
LVYVHLRKSNYLHSWRAAFRRRRQNQNSCGGNWFVHSCRKRQAFPGLAFLVGGAFFGVLADIVYTGVGVAGIAVVTVAFGLAAVEDLGMGAGISIGIAAVGGTRVAVIAVSHGFAAVGHLSMGACACIALVSGARIVVAALRVCSAARAGWRC